MRRQYGTRMYDTQTAVFVGTWSKSETDDDSWISEALCRKRNGEYFLYVQGGASSKYARRSASGGAMYEPGEDVIPLTDHQAHDWAVNHLDPVAVSQEFDVYGHGEFSGDELDETVAVTFRLSRRVREALNEYAREHSITRNDFVERLLRRELDI